MKLCNYGNTSISWTAKYDSNDNRKPGHMPWDNSIRILIDSRAQMINLETGDSEWFYLITPCRTEWMYRDDMLFKNDPNLEFVGIYSDVYFRHGHVQVRDKLREAQDIDIVKDISSSLPDFKPNLSYYSNAVELKNDEEIVEATINLIPIIATTEIISPDKKFKAIIEYPIKTMNIQKEKKRMQIDTGPILFPDFDYSVNHQIERFFLSFICYNNLKIAEFVIRVPTHIGNEDTQDVYTMEYSKTKRLSVESKLYACTI